MSIEPISDRAQRFRTEAGHLLSEAERRNITLRLLGALAIQERCPEHSYLLEEMRREYLDLDLVGLSEERSQLKKFMTEMDYAADREMLVIAEGTRYLFRNRRDDLIVDLFIDELNFCHRLYLRERLRLDGRTIPLADLLLSKLQIVEIADKDFQDVAVLLLEHEVGEIDGNESIDSAYISKLLAADWGFYRTVSHNLEMLLSWLQVSQFTAEFQQVVASRISRLLTTMEASPKTTRWKLRATLGTIVPWYKPVSRRDHAF